MSETKPLAWNEIFIRIPTSWDVDQLDDTYLLIGEDKSPCLELKWAASSGRIKPETQLKKFVSRARQRLGIQIIEQSPPSFFTPAENSFEYFFFSWKQEEKKGDGVIIFCQNCKKLTLFRFFPGLSLLSGGCSSLAARILDTFCDHPKNKTTPWSIFGMHFSLPKAFSLKNYNFSPGCFTLEFKQNAAQVKIFSWGPASFLLSKTDLSGFAMQRVKDIEGLGVAGTWDKGAFVQWQFKKQIFDGADRLFLLNRFTRYKVFRICTDEADNRILGILAESSRRFETRLIRESFIDTP